MPTSKDHGSLLASLDKRVGAECFPPVTKGVLDAMKELPQEQAFPQLKKLAGLMKENISRRPYAPPPQYDDNDLRMHFMRGLQAIAKEGLPAMPLQLEKALNEESKRLLENQNQKEEKRSVNSMATAISFLPDEAMGTTNRTWLALASALGQFPPRLKALFELLDQKLSTHYLEQLKKKINNLLPEPAQRNLAEGAITTKLKK